MVGVTASALIGVLNPLLCKLCTLLGGQYGRLKGVRREISSLHDELRSMNAALEVASQLEEPNTQTKQWMDQVRELSYDVEDCIDVFMHHLGEDDNCSGIIRKTSRRLKTLRVRHRIARQICELKERAKEVSRRRRRYEIEAVVSDSSSSAIDPRLPALFEEANRLVGIDGPRNELVKWLNEDTHLAEQAYKVVSIVGFGGLGKTTLANQVYQSIKSQYDCTAFVSVSRNPDINKILTDLLWQVLDTSNPISECQKKQIKGIREDLEFKVLQEYDHLIRIIRDYLQNKRYFVIIDDIWSKKAWEFIRCAFPKTNSGTSRIMTTTRIQDVARFCCPSHEDYVYPMKPLSTDDSRTLLLKRTFHHESDCPPVLEEVVHEILKKCGGLPLAIINIGSLLARKPVTKQEWEKVHSSIGFALEKDQDLEVIKRILFLSYDDLPHQLKICLMYLSVFPEDFEIDRERLIWKWIAEGFINKQHGQSLEETGERCFNELMNRNMIQPVDIDYSGTPRACRVHDIMLDLIIKVSTEENFATLVVNDTNLAPKTIRRLSLQGKCEDITWPGTSSLDHVRSLTVHGTFNEIPPLQDLKVLRVLDLQDWHDTEDDCSYADDIGDLNHLRYLCLGKSSINEAPKQIGKLKNLQTLDLRACTKVKELPATITELSQLVRLFVWSGVRFPQGISRMRSLEELSKIDGSSNTADVMLELGELTRLKRLRVGWHPNGPVRDEESYKRSLATALRSLGEHNLRSLRVDYYQNLFYSVDFLVDSWQPRPRLLQSFEIFGPIYFTRAPPWMTTLSSLTCLSINIGRVEPQDVQVIKEIPALLFLYLYTKQPPEETLAISRGGFQCLKEFIFFPYYKDGRSLKFEAGAMPRLQNLSLGFVARDDLCGGDGAFDFGIRHLTCLKKVDVIVFCNRARAWEVEAAEEAVRCAVEALPNHPTLKMRRYFQDKMLKDEEADR